MKGNKIIERIKKLMAMARDSAATENEVLVAVSMANKLIKQYKLENHCFEENNPVERDVIRYTQGECEDILHWPWSIMQLLSEKYFCKVIAEKDYSSYKSEVKGKSVLIGMYLYVYGKKEYRELVIEFFRILLKKYRALRRARYSTYLENVKKGLSRKFERAYILNNFDRLIKDGVVMNESEFKKSYYEGVITGFYNQILKDSIEDCKQIETSGLILTSTALELQSAIEKDFENLTTQPMKLQNPKNAAFLEGIKDGFYLRPEQKLFFYKK